MESRGQETRGGRGTSVNTVGEKRYSQLSLRHVHTKYIMKTSELLSFHKGEHSGFFFRDSQPGCFFS